METMAAMEGEDEIMKDRGRKRYGLEDSNPAIEEEIAEPDLLDEDEPDYDGLDEEESEGAEDAAETEESKPKSPRLVAIPKCPENRDCCPDCQAYRDGKCAALSDVTFKDNRCPFYKDREKARSERIAAMEKLEDTGRRDLIRKYYGGPHRFNRILGNELVGESYNFDDDGCVYADEEEMAGTTSEGISTEADADSTDSDDGAQPDTDDSTAVPPIEMEESA